MGSNVEHPVHYVSGKYECISVMKDVFGAEALRHFCLLNAFKYIWRSERKGGEEDLEKASYYLEVMKELKEMNGEADEQPDILKDKQDEKITIPFYQNYPVVPTNPAPNVAWTGGELTVTNTEIKCETPVRDRMVGKVSNDC